ncbi:MAG TPA: LLM class flavin-dependent oxidoreductase, partial [Dehalococcoidia bacterium]|nr:LLM class flavin-dependent oxidoreductase [Dehalococcoidia bacterium]
MKFGISYNLVCPRPLDSDQWHEEDEHKLMKETLEQVEFADKLGFDYVWGTEHHFLEEYSISSAPEVWLSAVAEKTKNIRLGHGIVHMPPKHNHPARVAERIAMLDLVSDGRVEFGTGEGATVTETGGFLTPRAEKKEAWEEATREACRMMAMTPYPGYEGIHFCMPERNIIPKPLQKPHPPLWVAASRLETAMLGARFGMGALGVGFDTPEEADERVKRYWDLARRTKTPIGLAMNPAISTSANLMMGKTNEEAMKRGLRGAQYFGFSLAFTNGEVHHGKDHLNRMFTEKFGREGEEKP